MDIKRLDARNYDGREDQTSGLLGGQANFMVLQGRVVGLENPKRIGMTLRRVKSCGCKKRPARSPAPRLEAFGLRLGASVV
jgi:hypothetical protein